MAKNTKPNKKKIIIIASAVLVMYLLFELTIGGPVASVFKEEKKQTVNTAEVSYGSVTKMIEGSGTVMPNDEYLVTSMVRGDIIADYIEEGTVVKEGDVLYEIDPDDINKSITSAKENVQKAQMSLSNAQKTADDLYVKSDIAGTITELSVKIGDDINAGQTVAKVVDSENLTLKITFNSNDAKNIHEGEAADITFATTTSKTTGVVKSVSSGTVVNSEGVPVSNVEISVKNPGAIVEGDIATASVGSYACNSHGTFTFGETKVYTAKASGKISSLNFVEGDKVERGSSIMVIDSTDAKNRLTEAQISYNQAVRQLEDCQDSLTDDYSIKAKVSGEIVQKNSKKGDTLDSTNGATTMAIIQDTTSLIFSMSIDELDITDIKVGQSVEVVADAIEGVTYKGTVTTKSTVGTSQNGVTTYPVEVTLTEADIEMAEQKAFGKEDYERRLIPGMNVTGDIVVASKKDVLVVPVSAIRRGNTVVAKGKKSDKNTDMPSRIPGGVEVPEGYGTVSVEVGLTDDNFAEIISGLSEGDIIIVPDVTIESQNPFEAMMSGHMNAVGGGGPQGGPPSGGPQGGGAMGGRARD